MSFTDCILRALKDGKISKEKAADAQRVYEEHFEALRGAMGDAAAEGEAGARAWESMNADLAEKKRQTLLQVKRWSGIEKDMKQFRNAKGEADYAAAMAAHLSRDDRAPFANVEGRHASILNLLQGQMTDLLARFRGDLLGRTRDKSALKDVLREVFGEDTGSASAKELAESWGKTAERARQWFNQAGGRIPKREDWGLPQAHDSVAVGKASFNEWRDFIFPLLNPDKMINDKTGFAFTREQLELALKDVYETIRSDGLNKVDPGKQTGSAMLANRRLDHRFLVFKDAESWLKYNDRFGGSDVFSAMMGHLDHMARDIASLQVLGPNPTATLRYMEDLARKQGFDAGRLDHANGLIKDAWDMWGLHSGSTLAPINAKFARTMAGVRSVLQSAQLGSAVFSSLTDLSTGRLARKMAGLPQAKMLVSYAKLLNPADVADRKLAVRLGLGAQGWSSRALGQMRYFGEIGPEISRRLSSAVSTLSGHTAWIQAGRWAFGMEFMATLAEHAGLAFDDLPAPLQSTMKRYGIGADRWDVLRATPMYQHEGASFLRPEDISARTDMPAAVADEHAFRLLEMIQAETSFAVPTTSLRGRAALTGPLQPGTIQGELLRSGIMYKSFAVTMWHTHITRAMMQRGALSKAGYFANFVISATLMGGLAMQLKQIARGADPMPMNKPEFWARAMFQGGGLGIFGDFIGSAENRFGGGLAETLAGPVAGLATDVLRATAGNAFKAMRGQDTSVGNDISGLLRRYTPGGTIWYARAAFERLVLDNMQKMIDPDWHDRFRRKEEKLRTEQGQRYWWRPGHNTPDRAPDISNAGGK
jgi:hypothetical protein